MVALAGALDFWNLLVSYTFGSFWLAVIGIALLIFVIMTVLGRVSIYSVTWYVIMFILCMTLGYGAMLINALITLALIVAFYFSAKSYIDSK